MHVYAVELIKLVLGVRQAMHAEYFEDGLIYPFIYPRFHDTCSYVPSKGEKSGLAESLKQEIHSSGNGEKILPGAVFTKNAPPYTLRIDSREQDDHIVITDLPVGCSATRRTLQ
ncbi:uncharacterized protein MCYG_04818 [Microsporum canis CBS 113480]|uniref:Uncharacterized protein n=1 Tax=Arthroderma otae (strain ATCC MYA-4605 / CBS 113480) TaxID=554155 RepID=C5FQ46_ARTOC|nr:uncharacterized protein MCYG_04818 [Microsporum canis CBS 113480]EEQ31999.1 predicted protein [Microsporum canis CBS 113480]